jgi:choline dehydrogenase-like flavoprotein
MPDIKYDAIVVGSGISGGWAARELCEKGLKTLVLERGTLKIIQQLLWIPGSSNIVV